MASWYDHEGKRRTKSTGTTDKAAASRILKKAVADAALLRSGVIDAQQDQLAIEGRKALADHIAAYITHCRSRELTEKVIAAKQSHLSAMQEVAGITRLSELDADALERHLWSLRQDGKAARTVNYARQDAVAFMSWAMKTGRVDSNRLQVVRMLDETRDRRRRRRALTEEELAALIAVAEPRGRAEWYLAAALAGLRKGDLKNLRWCDIDFDAETITVTEGKAKRCDVLPLHPQLAEALKQRLTGAMATPKARVFPTTVTDRTRQKDFLRAGIAREEVVTDDAGKPVMVGKRRQRPKTRIITEDADGRVIDLHALRTTLGTQLARAGVAPQIAQRIMRHSDYRTTLEHYTVLGLADTAAAMDQVPSVGRPDQGNLATGTADERAAVETAVAARTGASRCNTVRKQDETSHDPDEHKSLSFTPQRHRVQPSATACEEAGEGDRTLDIQLGKLTLYR